MKRIKLAIITSIFILISTNLVAQTKIVGWNGYNSSTASFPISAQFTNSEYVLISGTEHSYNGLTTNNDNRTVWENTNTSTELDTNSAPYLSYKIMFLSSISSVTFDRFVLTGLAYSVGNSNSKLELRWNKDNFNSNLGNFTADVSTGNYYLTSVNLSGLGSVFTGEVEFRIYFYNSTSVPLGDQTLYQRIFNSGTGPYSSLDSTPSTYGPYGNNVNIWIQDYNQTITYNPVASAQDIKLNGTVSAESNQIKNVADPTDAQDAATKNYVDGAVITAQQASDITTNNSKVSFPGFGTSEGTAIEGNTTLFSGSYDDLTDKPTTISTQQASDITTNNAKVSFPGFGTSEGTALEGNTTLFSGSYDDLTNKPYGGWHQNNNTPSSFEITVGNLMFRKNETEIYLEVKEVTSASQTIIAINDPFDSNNNYKKVGSPSGGAQYNTTEWKSIVQVWDSVNQNYDLTPESLTTYKFREYEILETKTQSNPTTLTKYKIREFIDGYGQYVYTVEYYHFY